ncbi:hypothetical protein KFU94_05785 [Chloroflexi bacterium TSY]|nr:hypothetical protein [Chloroflexi bacterium TSY]
MTELPGEEAIRLKLNELGYGSNRVKKSQPVKRSQRPMRSLIEFIRSIKKRMHETVLRLLGCQSDDFT